MVAMAKLSYQKWATANETLTFVRSFLAALLRPILLLYIKD